MLNNGCKHICLIGAIWTVLALLVLADWLARRIQL
ncbi:hypothetical protein EV690_3423 [Celerinatantimonas diazotrophica]|uniref:Uncharacterized protein n=1 Tax=Celerinatantimonas diazotrophica TaxID=412034 RepID=A0A4V2PNC8_9GAMM|nr:hypothetical protein EV690_3423 [Celerinatantimonas diazotrophica]CAG9296527.1 hypothetical protein CEDIAZO_01678 [Celerinatantimonas diazotrophica]